MIKWFLTKRLVANGGVLLLALFLSSGCMRLVFGIKKPSSLNEKGRNEIERRINGDFIVVEIDTALFNKIGEQIDEESTDRYFFQPMQFYLYCGGKLFSGGANCAYPGFSPKWNFKHQFDSIKPWIPHSFDTTKVFREIYSNVHKPMLNNSERDTVIIMVYSSLFYRQAKKFPKHINQLRNRIPNAALIVMRLDALYSDARLSVNK